MITSRSFSGFKPAIDTSSGQLPAAVDSAFQSLESEVDALSATPDPFPTVYDLDWTTVTGVIRGGVETNVLSASSHNGSSDLILDSQGRGMTWKWSMPTGGGVEFGSVGLFLSASPMSLGRFDVSCVMPTELKKRFSVFGGRWRLWQRWGADYFSTYIDELRLGVRKYTINEYFMYNHPRFPDETPPLSNFAAAFLNAASGTLSVERSTNGVMMIEQCNGVFGFYLGNWGGVAGTENRWPTLAEMKPLYIAIPPSTDLLNGGGTDEAYFSVLFQSGGGPCNHKVLNTRIDMG